MTTAVVSLFLLFIMEQTPERWLDLFAAVVSALLLLPVKRNLPSVIFLQLMVQLCYHVFYFLAQIDWPGLVFLGGDRGSAFLDVALTAFHGVNLGLISGMLLVGSDPVKRAV